MTRRAIVLLGVLLSVRVWAADFVWIEGEKPTASNFTVSPSGWGNKQFLSEQAWLHLSLDAGKVEQTCPPEGVLLTYDATAAAAGRYEVWNRIGFEFVRSPFDWRLDEGAWQSARPQDLTCDLMEIAEWCEVAWLKLGEADLAAGRHTLQIRLPRTYTEKDGKRTVNNILYASDALCLVRGAVPPGERWRPHSFHKPDEAWQSDDDRAAAAHLFALPAAAPRPGERIETPLAGAWQVCRYDEQDVVDRPGPTQAPPDDATSYWMAMPVPGNKFAVKPELRLCHRFAYRTRLDVPAALAGRSFVLRCPSLSMIATVFVNGQACGWTKAPFAQWDCDLTRAVKPGQANELVIVIKDAYYAFSEKKSGKSCRLSFNVPWTWMGSRNHVNQTFDFPVGAEAYAQQAGLLETPSVIVTGPAYASDVFVRPSVKAHTLTAEVTLRNPGAAEQRVQVTCEALPAGGGAAAKRLTSEAVTLAAGQEQTVTLAAAWPDARLWWPDDPVLYQLVTTVQTGGQTVDVVRTPFGFREWGWSGKQFTCNGVPWQFWADTTGLGGGRDPEAAVAHWRQSGQNMWRFWERSFGGLNKQQALDLMDARGIVVRRSGIFDGQGANYLAGLADNKELYDNWITQMQAWVREERNHPSILIWTLENEITFINSRNLGMSTRVEPEISRGAQAVMALDPTRPVMVDGGNCLIDKSLPVNGGHYLESAWRDYPDEAYTLARAYAAHNDPNMPTWGRSPWQLMPDRPIFLGESFYARGSTPSAFAQFGGEGCFEGWGENTRVGVGRLARMLAEGYRWHGVAAHHFWLSRTETDLHYPAWQPVALLCREWNWTFGGGGKITRTLKVFNNTHLADPIEASWTLLAGGKPVAGEKRVCRLAPGGNEEFTVTVAVPPVKQRTAAQFVLTCARGGKELFRDTKPVALINPDAGPKPALKAGELAVLDPGGSVTARLRKRGVPFVAVAQPAAIPATAKVVVVGPDALNPAIATDPMWTALAARGARVLVLEQQQPLHFLAVPADLAPTDHCGSIAFSENLTHPVFAGLDQPDFFTWSGGSRVYRNSYRKATQGAVSLVQCDEMLGESALAECPVNEGLLLLCQLVVGEKLATDPVAQRLFDNLLGYCATYKPVRRSTAVAMDPASPAAKLLAASGLVYDSVPDVLAALGDKRHEIVVAEATPAVLQKLAGAAAAVTAFTDRGGWLMLWGLTPEGLADFNRVVGVAHLLRPFELERVALPTVRDPLLAGLTSRDVTMESAEQIFPWAGDKYLVDDEFTSVVDLEDVAPFAALPNAKAGDHAAAKASAAGWTRNLVNGFTSADAWKLIYYMGTDNAKVTLTLPRPETVDRFSLVLNTHYSVPTQVKLFFDDDPTPVVLKTEANGERQDFALAPRAVTRLMVELAAFNKPGPTTGIDNLWLRAVRPPAWRQKVRPLLNVGGLVKYAMGPGGIILNQLNVRDAEPVPANLQKKRVIVATLLRNLHATFAGGKVLTTANLKLTPVPLLERCNQFLTAAAGGRQDKGWLDGGRDLAAFPRGEIVLGGVPYVVRDFKTSPLPSCLMLAGPGARGQLPGEITGLPVGAKAERLYFLHTFNRVAEWRAQRKGDAPPVLFRYVIHYADGQTVEAPVVYGEGVGHWVAPQPAGLKSASVAWAAPFPGETSPDQAVVYQKPWTNPRPEVEISSFDLLYGPAGSRYGTPALLALTAGTPAGK